MMQYVVTHNIWQCVLIFKLYELSATAKCNKKFASLFCACCSIDGKPNKLEKHEKEKTDVGKTPPWSH